jgi:hypothetical protein
MGDQGQSVAVETLCRDALCGGATALDGLDEPALALLVVNLCDVFGEHDAVPFGGKSLSLDISYIRR